MRRFSQRNSLVTLNEINITPLLDLAFVLLIIFIIVSGSIKLEQGLDVNLPEGGAPREQVNAQDIRTITITRDGQYALGNRPMNLEAVEREIVAEFRRNPKLVVDLRVDGEGTIRSMTRVWEMLRRNGLERFALPTVPSPERK